MDTTLGWDRWSDCLLLHTLVYRRESPLADALGPPIFQLLGTNAHWPQCSLLRRDVEGDMPAVCRFHAPEHDPQCGALRYDYTRYWHGGRALASPLLLLFEVDRVRESYRIASYVALLLLAAAILRTARPLWPALLPVPLVATTSFGLLYYGQSLMHSPPYLVILGGLILLTVQRDRLGAFPTLLGLATALGALCTFLEFWVGAIPVGASLLFYWVYFVHPRQRGNVRPPAGPFRAALAAVLAFFLGVGLSVALKLGFAALVFDGYVVVADFVAALGRRTWEQGHSISDVLAAMVEHHRVLGAGSSSLAKALVGTSVLGWIAGALLVAASAAKARSPARGFELQRDFCAALVAASIVLVWLFFFRNHSTVHARFMVRTLFVPVALGLAAPNLAWRAYRAHSSATRLGHAARSTVPLGARDGGAPVDAGAPVGGSQERV